MDFVEQNNLMEGFKTKLATKDYRIGSLGTTW